MVPVVEGDASHYGQGYASGAFLMGGFSISTIRLVSPYYVGGFALDAADYTTWVFYFIISHDFDFKISDHPETFSI